MNISFITVGGTIDKIYFDEKSQYEVGESKIEDILRDAKINFKYTITPVLKKDSLDMNDEDRSRVYEVAESESNDKIIITHGTDTIVETAKKLCSIKNKTIVLTGAMEPAIFKSSDAVFNLGFSICAVQSLKNGVYIAMSGRIFTPANVIKKLDKGCFEKKK